MKLVRIFPSMSTALDVIGLVSVATLFGSMAFFSGVVAPITFTSLDEESAGHFVRGLFPWYYLVIAGLALLATVALAAVRPLEAAVMALIALGAFVSRQLLMPRINDHRDRMLGGDARAERGFSRLHQWSVWINAAQLIGALAVLLLMAVA